MTPLRIFIGFDERQPLAWHVAAHSLMTRSSKPVAITPLLLDQLAPFQRRGLTQFTYSRFLVPHLSAFEGRALFIDSDILVLGDVAELFEGDGPAVTVRTDLPDHLKFEMPAVMLFDCARASKLTLEYAQTSPNPFNLAWANGDIGSLPREWHYLAGYDPVPEEPPKLIHYTMGVPIHPETKDSPFSDLYAETFKQIRSSVSWETLMGNSVHAVTHEGKRVPKLAVPA